MLTALKRSNISTTISSQSVCSALYLTSSLQTSKNYNESLHVTNYISRRFRVKNSYSPPLKRRNPSTVGAGRYDNRSRSYPYKQGGNYETRNQNKKPNFTGITKKELNITDSWNIFDNVSGKLISLSDLELKSDTNKTATGTYIWDAINFQSILSHEKDRLNEMVKNLKIEEIKDRFKSLQDISFKKSIIPTGINYSIKLVESQARNIKISDIKSISNEGDLLPLVINPPITRIAEIIYRIQTSTSSSIISLLKNLKIENKQQCIDYIFDKSFCNLIANNTTNEAQRSNISIDLTKPEEWFSNARRLHRKIYMHVGPTNSGKTYNALQKLKKANSGYYSGPLRLLAREIYDRFQSENIPCNLVTGEEVINDYDKDGRVAQISSGTVEMTNITTPLDISVIDEIQMIGDSNRGNSWSNAVLGSQAKEIHLCGEESTIDLIKKMAIVSGDEVIIKKYKRLGKLNIESKLLGFTNLKKNLKRGDCIVAFSRKNIFQLKKKVEEQTDFRVAVIYGSLPPESRARQAQDFNNGNYDVLIASDAIGMGLNLGIKRVIFHSTIKFDGTELVKVPIPQVKQIAGRAGRYKISSNPNATVDISISGEEEEVKHEQDPAVGYVTAIDSNSLRYVRLAMSTPTINLTKASIFPSDDMLLSIALEYNDTSLIEVFNTISEEIEESKLYSIADLKPRFRIANVLNQVYGLTFSDQVKLSMAPVNLNETILISAFIQFSRAIANLTSKSISDFGDIIDLKILNLPRPYNSAQLSSFEILDKVLNLFLWLSNRFPNIMVDRLSARQLKNLCELRIDQTLEDMGPAFRDLRLNKNDAFANSLEQFMDFDIDTDLDIEKGESESNSNPSTVQLGA